MADEVLVAAGLSRPKVAHARALAAAFLDGRLSDGLLAGLADEAAVAAITAVRGLGPWTAEVYLLFALGRVDVFPAGDIAVAGAAADVLGLAARPGPGGVAGVGGGVAAASGPGGAAAVAPLAAHDGAAEHGRRAGMTEDEARAALAAAHAEIAALRARLAAVEGSRTWRMVAPALRLASRHPVLVAVATGRLRQVPAQLRARRLARAVMRAGLWDAAFYGGQVPETGAGGPTCCATSCRPGARRGCRRIRRSTRPGMRPGPAYRPGTRSGITWGTGGPAGCRPGPVPRCGRSRPGTWGTRCRRAGWGWAS